MTDKNDFFIGWADKPPVVDRRFFFGAGIAMLAGSVGLGAAIAKHQNGGGTGTWAQSDVREWRGTITADPFPMLRTLDENGNPKTALLSCLNKCAVKPQIDAIQAGEVIVRGSPIVRGNHLMIATDDFGAWIRPATAEDGPALNLSFPEQTPLGEIDLKGEILDTKCWFGAMAPGNGKVHKSCAALCIRSGLPPGFYVKSLRDQSRLMILVDEQGASHGNALLPLVADPLRLAGQVFQQEDLLFVRSSLASMARV